MVSGQLHTIKFYSSSTFYITNTLRVCVCVCVCVCVYEIQKATWILGALKGPGAYKK